jgi:Ca-activated chloride channel homolog
MKVITYILLLSAPLLFAQRSTINSGVDKYNEKKFSDAEVNFKKGLDKDPKSFEAHFNLGDAYYKEGHYDQSLKEYYSSLELTKDPARKASTYHNIGNSLLKAKKIKESIEAYKNSLKINPKDMETKYNLSYALSLLNNQQNQKNKQDNQQNKDNNDNKDQKKNQDQQNQDKNDQNKQNQQNKPEQNQQAQQDNLKAQKNQISKEEAERILQALKNNEKDIQKKLRKKTGATVKKEKDW